MDNEDLNLPTIERRMALIRESAERPGSFYSTLVAQSGGSLRSAAIVDLALDGNLHHVDLRRAPFAGNEELKALYRRTKATLDELSEMLIQLGWPS